ncbi:glycosyltransferase family 2 protein [Leucobacter coleopterorum]|uniref:Glycosyltransferase family 2 protein n=1 Tax=Leucobacter coleopterorum TaxID=2714933 RepID=A0ABX6K2P7_9MICO|nr:glycosyltransferase family 2 protein [Leucobacter coleopterorum]QIM19310.1 glycosyltransferase family 2 protein [Leucobacter coleopterorum]
MTKELPANPTFSVVVPVFNEEAGVKDFHEKLLLPELERLGLDFEIVYVNDGSRDNTLSIITRIGREDPRVRVVALSRNFGKEIATTAGIHMARGEATVIMDGDGQHPPAMLAEFIEKWRNGAQVVVGIRTKNENEGLVKRWGSKIFYSLFNATSGATLVPRSTDYRLIDREVREAFIEFPERQRITRALIDWLGFDRSYVEFDSPARLAGEASYSVRQLTRLAINSYISLSLKPLYFFGWVGAAITLLSFIVGIFVFVEQFLMGDPLGLKFTGAALLGVFVAFLVGIVLISQAMVAAYMAHIYEQTQGRPLFTVNRPRSVNL